MKALVRKEWREHRVFLLILYLIGALMLGALWVKSEQAISPFVAWHALVVTFGTVAAILIPNRLVVCEYGRGTQLFLESLPVARVTVLLSKLWTGWFALLLFMAPAFGLVLWAVNLDMVAIPPELTGLAALRSAVYLLFVYSAATAIALTLRFRFAVWGLVLLAGYVVSTQVQLPAGQWPPFFLVRETMVLEAENPPWRELAITFGVTLALLGAALALALAVQGALVLALARRLSARSRTLLAFAFGAVVSLGMLMDERTEPPPFSMQAAVSSPAYPAVNIGWHPPIQGIPAAQLAERISKDLGAMQQWLGMDTLPELSVVADAWREADYIELDEANDTHIVLRAALGDPMLPLARLEGTIRASQIAVHGPVYDWREDRAWLIWGFSMWWGAREDNARAAQLRERALAAASLLAAQGMSMAEALRASETSYELLGDCLDEGFTWHAVQTLHDSLGAVRFRALMRAALGEPHADRVQSLARIATTERLLTEAGLPLGELAAAMQRGLPLPAEAQSGDGGPAQPLPSLQVTSARLGGDVHELRYQVTGVPADSELSIRFKPLLPMESRVNRRDTLWAGSQRQGVLPATFAGGTRVLVTAEASEVRLGCRYRVGAVRKEVP